MSGGSSTMTHNGKEMSVLMDKSIDNRLFIFKNTGRETNHAISIVGQTCRNSIAPPNNLRNVSQRKLVTQLAETGLCGSSERFGMRPFRQRLEPGPKDGA